MAGGVRRASGSRYRGRTAHARAGTLFLPAVRVPRARMRRPVMVPAANASVAYAARYAKTLYCGFGRECL